MPIVDLTHTIEHDMVTYPGLPGPAVTAFMSHDDSHARYAPGTEFHIGRIEMVANTGTYIDAPYHRYRDGADIASLALEQVAGLPGALVHVQPGTRTIGADCFAGVDVNGRAVLVHTGWDRHWRTACYADGHPFLARDAAQCLVERGAALVGIDSLNIDDTADPERPVHTLLLGAGIPIVEHLARLGDLPDREFRVFAVPLPVRGLGSCPVRAFAITS